MNCPLCRQGVIRPDGFFFNGRAIARCSSPGCKFWCSTDHIALRCEQIRKGCDWPECQCDEEGECELEETITYEVHLAT